MILCYCLLVKKLFWKENVNRYKFISLSLCPCLHVFVYFSLYICLFSIYLSSIYYLSIYISSIYLYVYQSINPSHFLSLSFSLPSYLCLWETVSLYNKGWSITHYFQPCSLKGWDSRCVSLTFHFSWLKFLQRRIWTGAGKVVQWVKGSPQKHVDVRLMPSTRIINWVAFVCHLELGKHKQVKPQDSWVPTNLVKNQRWRRGSVSETEMDNTPRKTPEDVF